MLFQVSQSESLWLWDWNLCSFINCFRNQCFEFAYDAVISHAGGGMLYQCATSNQQVASRCFRELLSCNPLFFFGSINCVWLLNLFFDDHLIEPRRAQCCQIPCHSKHCLGFFSDSIFKWLIFILGQRLLWQLGELLYLTSLLLSNWCIIVNRVYDHKLIEISLRSFTFRRYCQSFLNKPVDCEFCFTIHWKMFLKWNIGQNLGPFKYPKPTYEWFLFENLTNSLDTTFYCQVWIDCSSHFVNSTQRGSTIK